MNRWWASLTVIRTSGAGDLGTQDLPDTRVREVMTGEVTYCFDDEDTEHVARCLVGVLSLGDLAVAEGARAAGEALAGVAQPDGEHSQTGGQRW
jgi:hypothetical protein